MEARQLRIVGPFRSWPQQDTRTPWLGLLHPCRTHLRSPSAAAQSPLRSVGRYYATVSARDCHVTFQTKETAGQPNRAAQRIESGAGLDRPKPQTGSTAESNKYGQQRHRVCWRIDDGPTRRLRDFFRNIEQAAE